jgi:o-succinylbenzoate synthase
MALEFEIIPYTLQFKFDARTSRGSLSEHKTWFLKVWDNANPRLEGHGECAPFEGLSVDDVPDFDQQMRQAIRKIEGAMLPQSLEQIEQYVSHIDENLPSVRFGLETALRDLFYGGKMKIFDSAFYNEHRSIDINGLVWMGDKDTMLDRLELKILSGFECIKLKIGGINFADELEIIKEAKDMIDRDDLTIRVDANGAFEPTKVKPALELLAQLGIHSIEQPIKPGQWLAMAELARTSPVPIALDEELIGIYSLEKKKALLETIMPQYIVLKPTLLGGFKATEEWIKLANELNIGWWITSALESNIGLNAICQFTSQFEQQVPQGLGTGELYTNNIPSPLTMINGCIFWDTEKLWYLNLTERQA